MILMLDRGKTENTCHNEKDRSRLSDKCFTCTIPCNFYLVDGSYYCPHLVNELTEASK